jgi:putative DNA primase/helicase
MPEDLNKAFAEHGREFLASHGVRNENEPSGHSDFAPEPDHRQLSDLKAAAEAYHELKLPVIPFKVTKKEDGEYDKRNLGSWKKWETEPQTQEEFDALDWSEANAFAVILGTQAKNGHYLSVIDYDVKGAANEEIKAKGKEILRDFPITQTHETVNRGTHLVYWSRNKTRTDGTFHDTAGLELLGEKKLCLMPPSLGYKCKNDNSPTEIENLEETFYNILKKHGLGHTEETEVEQQLDAYSFSLSKLIDLSQMNKISPNEYQGSHPIHDSTTEKNFCVNTKTNTWHCFRHNSGGGALQYLAMKEGLIKCEQAQKGALRGKKFREVLTIAASQGLVDQKVLYQSEINPIVLAKDIMEDYDFVVDKASGSPYYFNQAEGIYSDKTEQLIKREIVRRLDENTKARYYQEVENFVTNSAPLAEMNTQPELLAVENGVLNVLTRQLSPFSPDGYLTQKLKVKYDPEAKCPAIQKFLGEVLEEKQRQIAQEFIGYALYRKITYHVCLLLQGPGRNGKSTLLELNTALLGQGNVSSQTIQSLCYNRFSLAELHHKLANISADLPSRELSNTGTFKMIVGGDRLPGEHKHKDPFNFDNYAKLMFSCNTIPPIASTEACLAFYSRFKILEFKQTFIGKKADKRLIEKLTTPEELSGYLNYALEGLKRLEERQDFTEDRDLEETEKAYVKLSNSCQAYINEKVIVTDTHSDYVFADVLYRDFITYCHNEKLQTHPKAAFTKAMQQFCNGAERARIRLEDDKGAGNPLSAWRYIKLVPSVSAVPTFSNNWLGQKKNSVFCSEKEIVGKPCTDGTASTELASEESQATCRSFARKAVDINPDASEEVSSDGSD